jgi:hypothetical protein
MTKLLEIYAIYDKVSGKYSPLQLHENEQTAIRAFRQAMKNVNPEDRGDYELQRLGEFDQINGEIVPPNMISGPRHVEIDTHYETDAPKRRTM